jgi:serine/threonine protein kinase
VESILRDSNQLKHLSRMQFMATIHDPSTQTPQSVISVNRFVTRLLVQDTESHFRELCLLNEDLRSDSSWPHLRRNLKLAAGNLISSVHRVESCDLSASRPWIVLEHCSGGSLRNRLKNEPLSEPQIRLAAGTVAGVLMELHRLGLPLRNHQRRDDLLSNAGYARPGHYGTFLALNERRG